MQYHYPIDYDWSTEEIVDVIEFFRTVEKAYEGKIEAGRVLDAYRDFKKIVPSKSEEKTLFRQFEKESTYAPYKVVKEAQQSEAGKMISMNS